MLILFEINFNRFLELENFFFSSILDRSFFVNNFCVWDERQSSIFGGILMIFIDRKLKKIFLEYENELWSWNWTTRALSRTNFIKLENKCDRSKHNNASFSSPHFLWLIFQHLSKPTRLLQRFSRQKTTRLHFPRYIF